MKKTAVLCLLAAAMLCGCDSGNVNSVYEEQVTSHETISEVTDITDIGYESESHEDLSSEEEKGEILESADLFTKKAVLYFSGESDTQKYVGDLELRIYDSSENEVLDKFSIIENGIFYDYEYLGSELGLSAFADRRVVSVTRHDMGTYYERFFEIESDGEIIPITVRQDDNYTQFIGNEYEIISRGITCSVNQYMFEDNREIINSSDLTDCIFPCYDYGSSYMGSINNRYVEYRIDCKNDELYIAGCIEYKSDEDIMYSAMRAVNRLNIYSGHAFRTFAYDYMEEELPLSDNSDIVYRRVEKDFAADRNELIEFLKEGFSERYIGEYFADMEADLFEGSGDDAIFSEDENGLIYIDCYRGVPVNYDMDSIKVINRDEDRVDAIILGSQIDTSVLNTMHFVKENGEWKYDGVTRNVAGCYFE